MDCFIDVNDVDHIAGTSDVFCNDEYLIVVRMNVVGRGVDGDRLKTLGFRLRCLGDGRWLAVIKTLFPSEIGVLLRLDLTRWGTGNVRQGVRG